MNIHNPHLLTRVPSPPPLEQGDHLTRAEFERRYEAMPELKKAELIEGVVYMPSPVRLEQHASPHAQVVGWLIVYEASTPGVKTADNGTVRLDNDNEPQPDAALLIKPGHGGQVQVSDDGYVVGAPELVVEVAASSVSIDLHKKRQAYARNGVREYIVWRTQDEAIDWFVLRGGAYEANVPDGAGRYRSERFPGLWLDAGALLRGDLATVLRVLQEGIASPEHAAFVAALERAGAE
ncbi:MAG TPA: Uma2 family endonuclease [Gemmataceae bacterium]|nr:Uma2 family endonuclease [Gemmataceae bacterium]